MLDKNTAQTALSMDLSELPEEPLFMRLMGRVHWGSSAPPNEQRSRGY